MDEDLRKRAEEARRMGWSEDRIARGMAQEAAMRLAKSRTEAPAPKRKASFLARNADIIGSIGGGVLGAVGGLPGIIAGSAAGGAAGNAIKQKATKGSIDLKEVGKEGLISGGSSLVFGGAGKVMKLGKAAKAAKAGIDVIDEGNILTKAGKAVRKGVTKPQVPTGPMAIKQEGKMMADMADEGLRGSPQAQRAQSAKKFDEYGNQIKETLKQNKTRVGYDDTINSIKASVDDNINFSPGDPAFEKARERALSKLKSLAKDGTLSADDIFEYKKHLSSRLNNAFKKKAGSLDSAYTINEAAEMSIWESIDDTLTKIAPEVKDLTLKQSKHYGFAPGLEKSANELYKVPVLGARIPANPFKAGQDLVGRGLEASGQGVPAAKIAAQQIAGRAAIATPEEPAPMEAPVDPMNFDMVNQQLGGGMPTAPAAAPEVPAGPKISQEDMARLMMMDLQETGGKNIPEMEKIYKTLTATDNAKVPVAVQKESMKADTASAIADQVEQSLAALGGGQGRLSGIMARGGAMTGSNPEVTAYQALRQASVGPLARAISGEVGTLTDADIARADGLLPKVTDTPEEAQLKLANLRRAIAMKNQNLQTVPDAFPASPQDVMFDEMQPQY